MIKASTNKGFTLIEVMVAVAIIGVALPAIIIAILGKIDGLIYISDKLDGQMVAGNIQQELLIRNSLSGKIPENETGKTKMGPKEWHWQTDFKAYPQEELADIFAVEIKVWSMSESSGSDDFSKRTPIATYFSALIETKPTKVKSLKIEPFPVVRKAKSKKE